MVDLKIRCAERCFNEQIYVNLLFKIITIITTIVIFELWVMSNSKKMTTQIEKPQCAIF
jgi:hypothetical protein